MNKEKLKRMVEKHAEWTHWRTASQMKEQRGTKLVLAQDSISGADFTDLELPSAEFHDVDLTDVTFSRANLSGAVFLRCDLTNSNFEDCNLPKGIFFRCNLFNVNFENTRCYKCEFDECQMNRAVFKNSNLQYAVISNFVLRNVDFSYADCHRLFVFSCKFVHCFAQGIKNIDSATLKNTYIKKNGGHFELVNSLSSIISSNYA